MKEAEARRNFIEATINAGAGVYVDIDAVAEMLRVEEEIQQYRVIGTVEELKALKEKQIAKKPVGLKKNICPNCSWGIIMTTQKYCDECGQKLDR